MSERTATCLDAEMTAAWQDVLSEVLRAIRCDPLAGGYGEAHIVLLAGQIHAVRMMVSRRPRVVEPAPEVAGQS